jgi:ankyrin repeat protein
MQPTTMPSFLSQTANKELFANVTSSLPSAVRSGSLTAIEAVINSQGAAQLVADNSSYVATVIAIRQGQLPAVQSLITKTNLPINVQGSTGNTVLIFACEFNQYAIAEYLLQIGADVTLKNKRGDTALAVARKKGYTNLANLLLNYGATM